LSTTDLIVRRAVALQKRFEQLSCLRSNVYATRLANAHRFEIEHAHTIKNYDFKRGILVLMRHTAIEKSLNRKMRPRYLGPLVVISRNCGGAYILAELDGSVLDRPIAAFRVIPYFARREPIPIDLSQVDIDTHRLRELETSETAGIDDEEEPTVLDTQDDDD
ncbi:hypothetical protein FA95DRAFT_1467677, partial [Auriscalpium vulgare]